MTAEWPAGLPTQLRPLEVVGEGTSATVWRVRDRRHGRDVAVKILRSSDPRRAELSRARLELEGRALARLRDVAGVVTVHELGITADGTGWLVTEFVDAGSLADRGPGSIAAIELAPMARVLSAALAEVHDREVVHGDLSPANLLLDSAGRPRLADFGLAALHQHQGHPGGLTPAYAAPERLAGAPPSPAGDVYALAASLTWVLEPGDRRSAGVLASAQHPDPADRPDARSLSELLGGSRPQRDPGRRSRGGR